MVTVIVDEAVPFAVTPVAGVATAVDLLALIGSEENVTVAVWAIVTPSVVSVAVYVTVCAALSVTVKVATPLEFVVVGDVAMTEDPTPSVRVTVSPTSGLP